MVIGSNQPTERIQLWRPWARHWGLPLVGGVIAISSLVVVMSYFAANRSVRAVTLENLNRVLKQCQDASYPLSYSVISQISIFSNTDIAIVKPSGQITATTLPQSDPGQAITPTEIGKIGILTVGDITYDYVMHDTPVQSLVNEESRVAVFAPSSRRVSMLRQTVLPQVTMALASIAIIALIASWLIARTTKRLATLETQIRRIAEGEYLVLDQTETADTFARLSDSINSMSRQLAQAHDRIAKTERSRLINLVANGIAHQLRNTLTGASLLLQSYVRQPSVPEAEEVEMAIKQLNYAQESVRRLLASDANSELVDSTPLSIQLIHQRLNDAIRAYADHRNVGFNIFCHEVDDETVELPQGNEIVGALVNLVMNAIEAVGTGGEVTCTLEIRSTDPGQPLQFDWQVIDNGPGPPAELADFIMETFVTSKPEGIGLGLPMAARIAKRGGGSLSWERSGDRTIFHFKVLGRVEHG